MMFAVFGINDFTLIPFIVILGIVTVSLFILIFEVWMFVDAIKNRRLTGVERLIWCIGMLCIHPFVAIAYYFIAKNPKEL